MTMKQMIKVAEILHGCQPGRLQSVGIMQVIPLTSELSDQRFAPPNEALISTATYGTLVVRNDSDKPMIVPIGATYIVDQAAQNHALPHAGFVKGKECKRFTTAMCVQQTQGGTIKEGKHTMMLLPFQLKEKAHKIRSLEDFRRLWPAIAEFNSMMGVSVSGLGWGHLEYFFDHYKNQLDSFVAQFEPVPQQVGAIVLIAGKVVGVERMPSHGYFSAMWRPLIRECYGSLAIMEANKAQGNIPVPKTRVPIRKVRAIADLGKALREAQDEEHNQVCTLVDNLIKVELDCSGDDSAGPVPQVGGRAGAPITVDALGETPFVGQMVREGKKVLYSSLIATEYWRQNEDWLMARPFAMPRRTGPAPVASTA